MLKLLKKLKVEIDLTKTDIDKLRRIIGLKTQTRADVVLRSFVKMVVNDPDALEIIQYDKRINAAEYYKLRYELSKR